MGDDLIDRRALLGLGSRAAAGALATSALARALAPGLAWAGTRHTRPHRGRPQPDGWPAGRLSAADAATVDAEQFLAVSQLSTYGEQLNQLGLRNTGGAKHEAFVRTMAARLRAAGVQNVSLEAAPLKRWEATNWSITVNEKTYPWTFYVPYSQATGPGGLTAEMVYLPPSKTLQGELDQTDMTGKIVVFEVPYTSLLMAEFHLESYTGGWYPQGAFNDLTNYTRPWFNSIATTLDQIIAGGAVGAIGFWPDLPGEWALQYTPYDYTFRPIPGLWIDMVGGAELKNLAANGAEATLVLEAEITDVNTHNVIGYIPGASSELTMLHTHTDGTNGMEENGALGLLAAAQYLARLPQSSLPRTVLIMLSTGHFAEGVGIRQFLTQHATDIVPRITAGLTLEHLGCIEWLPDASGNIANTGKPELAAWFGPPSSGLVNTMLAAQKADAIPGTLIKPILAAPTGFGTVKQSEGWPGEGTYFWWFGDVLDGNLITGPYGLITAGLDITGMVDYSLMQTVAMDAVTATLQLAGTSAAELAEHAS